MNLSTLLLFLVAVVGARLAWRRGARTLAAGAAAAAVLFGASLWQSTHPVVLALLLALAGGVLWHRYGSTVAVVTRWGSAVRRKSGVASTPRYRPSCRAGGDAPPRPDHAPLPAPVPPGGSVAAAGDAAAGRRSRSGCAGSGASGCGARWRRWC